MNVLFVDLSNICRSPLAAALLKKKYLENGIKGVVDSAGFESFTINEPPDSKAVNVAAEHGVLLDGRARIFQKSDFDKFDKIYVMDTQNYQDVMELARSDEHKAKVDYLLNTIDPGKNNVITDPCSSGVVNLEGIYQTLDKATDKIIEMIKKEKE
jgi:protein-tyrosine phosphatase